MRKISEQTISGYNNNVIESVLNDSNNMVIKTTKIFNILTNKVSSLSLKDVSDDTNTEMKNTEKFINILEQKIDKYWSIIEPYSDSDMTPSLKQIYKNHDKIEDLKLLTQDLYEVMEFLVKMANGDLKKHINANIYNKI